MKILFFCATILLPCFTLVLFWRVPTISRYKIAITLKELKVLRSSPAQGSNYKVAFGGALFSDPP